MHFPWVVIFNTKVSILPLKCLQSIQELYSDVFFFRSAFQTFALHFFGVLLVPTAFLLGIYLSILKPQLFLVIYTGGYSSLTFQETVPRPNFFPFHFLIQHIPLFYCCLLSVTSRTWKTFPFQTHHSTLQVGVCSSTFNPLASNDFSLLVLSDVDAESLYAPGMLLQSVYPLDSVQ